MDDVSSGSASSCAPASAPVSTAAASPGRSRLIMAIARVTAVQSP
jgi:hypothetical protein